MGIDYRKLCVELFGTDDVEKLKKIAQKAKDNHNAGRKQKFTEKEMNEIEKMLEKGMTMSALTKCPKKIIPCV